MYEALNESLLEAKRLTKEQVKDAEKYQSQNGGSLISSLLKLGTLTEEDVGEFLSEHYGVEYIDPSTTDVDPRIVRLIPADVASRFQVIPLEKVGRRLTVAMSNPSNIFALDDIKFITGCEVVTKVAGEHHIKKAIDRLYDNTESLANVIREFDEDLEVVDTSEDDQQSVDVGEITGQEAPVVKLVNSVLADAIRRGASDIHIEPYEKKMRVRFRIDGELYEMMSPPFRMKNAVLSRLKIMAELDIAERRVPQDGRIKIKMLNKTIDLRVSSLPTIFGEKIVMRILDKSNLDVDLTKAGFEPSALKNLTHAVSQPYGMVLVTGPTGSGKTTTLYSCLSRVNVSGVNIMTVEDPVEYNLDGINQVNVNDEVGLTFAAALRSFLRQDPNIVMVGEIRDLETGSIAVKAALTGHLVLSTLHTNDAPSTLNRLVDMGVEPFLVASSVNLIMAQRLIRRVCTNCKEEVEVPKDTLLNMGFEKNELSDLTSYEGRGCGECSNTGYKGRTGVFEVLPISSNIREMILNRAPTNEIKQEAIGEGMISLRRHGRIKLQEGITTIEEVLKETAADD